MPFRQALNLTSTYCSNMHCQHIHSPKACWKRLQWKKCLESGNQACNTHPLHPPLCADHGPRTPMSEEVNHFVNELASLDLNLLINCLG